VILHFRIVIFPYFRNRGCLSHLSLTLSRNDVVPEDRHKVVRPLGGSTNHITGVSPSARNLIFPYSCIPVCFYFRISILSLTGCSTTQQTAKVEDDWVQLGREFGREGQPSKFRSLIVPSIHILVFPYFRIPAFSHCNNTAVKVGLPSLAKELCPSLPISHVVYSWRLYGRAFCCARKGIGSAVAMSWVSFAKFDSRSGTSYGPVFRWTRLHFDTARMQHISSQW